MRALLILCLAYILFIHGLGSTSLWDPDEPRQPIMAREMMERGDYVHPYLNGLPYLEKPPLHPWLITAAARLTGKVDETASRIPSAVAAALLLLLTCFVGRRLDHEVSGFLSALILATNYQFLGNARESVMDMTFAMFIGASIILGYLCIEKGRKWLLPLALLPCAAAILTKGPAGLVLPLAVLLLYSLATRRLRSMFLPIAAGGLLSLALAAIWFLAAGRAYAEEFILHQNIARYTTGFDHLEPFWYYFHKLFVNFLPWSLLLPFAAFFAFKRKLWLPLIWLVFTFAFFDISRSKRAIYLLSCYPACALLVGIYLKERWYALAEKGWTRLLLSIFGVVLAVAPLLLFPALRRVPVLQQMFAGRTVLLSALVALLFACGVFFTLSVLARAPGKNFLVLFTYLVVLGFVYHALYMPALDRSSKSVRLIADQVGKVAKDTAIYTYGFNSPALIFYMGRPIRAISGPDDILLKKDDIIVIAEDKYGSAEALKPLFPLSKKARYERDEYLILMREDGK